MKKQPMKRILALILALAMVLSLSAPAWAAEQESGTSAAQVETQAESAAEEVLEESTQAPETAEVSAPAEESAEAEEPEEEAVQEEPQAEKPEEEAAPQQDEEAEAPAQEEAQSEEPEEAAEAEESTQKPAAEEESVPAEEKGEESSTQENAVSDKPLAEEEPEEPGEAEPSQAPGEDEEADAGASESDGASAETLETAEASTAAAPVSTRNIDLQNYLIRSAPVSSHLAFDADNSFVRIEYNQSTGEVVVEKTAPSGALLSSCVLPMELPIYGGVFIGASANYLFLGQENWEEDDSREVIRVVKYSKDWKRLSSVSICGANTVVPFKSGSLRAVEAGDLLYVRTCHQMYKSTKDGLNHQANMAFVLKQSTMEITDSHYLVSNSGYGYVSHSFNQFIARDGENLAAADHGDAYPRGVVLSRIRNKAGEEKLTKADKVTILAFRGEVGANATGTSVGGLEISDSHYLVAGNSVAQDDNYNPNGVRNIFVGAVPKDNCVNDAVTLRWLTQYSGQEKSSTPHLVKLSGSRFLLMWMYNGELNSTFLNADGSQDGGIYKAEATLSDCPPVCRDNKLYWYVTNNSLPLWYCMDLTNPATVQALNPSHTVTFDAQGGSVSTLSMTVFHGKAYGDLPQPTHPQKWLFEGWYTQPNGGRMVKATSIVPVLESERFYAHWEKPDDWNYDEDSDTDGSDDGGHVTVTVRTYVDLSWARVRVSDQVYNGKARKPNPRVEVDGKVLRKDEDYTLRYKNNTQIGTATVIITGKGGYKGQTSERFFIIPQATKLTSVKWDKKAKAAKVAWKKNAKGTGYQLQYSTDKKFKKGVKTINIKKNKITSKTIKGMKKGKYFFRIRVVGKSGKKTIQSKWSAVKSLVVKK